MKISKFTSRKSEIIFISVGSILALAVIAYLFILVRLLAKKTNEVYGPLTNPAGGVVHFNFAEFDKIKSQLGSSTNP